MLQSNVILKRMTRGLIWENIAPSVLRGHCAVMCDNMHKQATTRRYTVFNEASGRGGSTSVPRLGL